MEFCKLRNFPLVNFLNRWQGLGVIAPLTPINADFCQVRRGDETFNAEHVLARDRTKGPPVVKLWRNNQKSK